MNSTTNTEAAPTTRSDVYKAKTPHSLFPLLVAYEGRPPTVREFRSWVNSVCGPFHIASELNAMCRKET